MASPIAQYPKTGIRVIIVGAGFGGLTAAIECTLKGHTAIIVEKTPTFEQLGDIISISEYYHFRIGCYYYIHQPCNNLFTSPKRKIYANNLSSQS